MDAKIVVFEVKNFFLSHCAYLLTYYLFLLPAQRSQNSVQERERTSNFCRQPSGSGEQMNIKSYVKVM